MRVRLKTRSELGRMRESGRIVAEVLALMGRLIRPGATPRELDEAAEAHIRSKGAVPSFKGYHGYPASLCVSINEQIVHGIPDGRVLESGDLVTVDCGAYLDGFHGDAARTFPVGEVDAVSKRLMEVCEASLWEGIGKMSPGARLGEVSQAIEECVKKESGFSVVRNYVGHGIGRDLHEDPQVPNFFDPSFPAASLVLEEGVVLAIEPMVNVGSSETRVLADSWTVVTADGTRSAHFEHSVAVTANGPFVMTEP